MKEKRKKNKKRKPVGKERETGQEEEEGIRSSRHSRLISLLNSSSLFFAPFLVIMELKLCKH